MVAGIKNLSEVKVGRYHYPEEADPAESAVQGFQEVKPMVFAGIYPVITEEFEELRDSLEKLKLNDASLVYQAESSAALGIWLPGRLSWACFIWRSYRKDWSANLTCQSLPLCPM